MRDHDLPILLRDAAGNLGDGRSLADALGIAALAAERRLGVWKAALARPDELSGRIRALRERADRILDPSSDAAPPSDDMPDALGWLLDAMRALAARLPSEILMPAEFYRSLAAADDAGCLAFAPDSGQLDAAAHLVRGRIVEMDAGEGKSLAAALAAAVLAASGRRVHVLTANDYLAARDCERHAPILESLGIRVGLIIANMDADERRHQHAREIVFATAREIGFDYLRDGAARRFAERVNPVFDVAIADEADHLLVDQARVPLIISGEPSRETAVGEDALSAALWMMDAQASVLDRLYAQIAGASPDVRRRALASILLGGGLSARLEAELERVGASARDALGDLLRMNDSEDGRPLERDLFFAVEPVAPPSLRLTERGWDEALRRVGRADAAFEVVQTLRARVIHQADEDYVADEEGVTLVDALDGRPLYAHRYMDGLHEALEAKEGAAARGRTPPRGMTTVRALMSHYRAVCGLTGTAMEAAPVFERDYGARTVRVPPAAPSRRADFPPAAFYDRAARDRALVEEAEKWRLIGRPVLLTVASPRESAELSRALSERGIPHRALDAANAGEETDVVESAGRFGAVTVAAGMAGRGTDIIPARGVGARVLAACADLARAEDTVFACATREEASALESALRERLADVCVRVRETVGDGGIAAEVAVRRRGESALAAPSVRRVEFGLGLIVVMASVPASARVERQIRGRAARRGEFGAAKMILRVNDPAIAFSRQQRRLMEMKPPDADFASGAEVALVLRRARDEAESAHRAAASVAAEFAAVIEAESRAHRAAREDLMDARIESAQMDALISAWAARVTDGLNDVRAPYDARFDRVEDFLRDEWDIDVSALYGESPAAVRLALRDAAARRAFALRDVAGGRRFGRLLAEARLAAADALFPARLAELQDAALSAMLGSLSLRNAVSHLADRARETRAAFWNAVDDALMRELLSADGESPRMSVDAGDGAIERLPPELAALIDER